MPGRWAADTYERLSKYQLTVEYSYLGRWKELAYFFFLLFINVGSIERNEMKKNSEMIIDDDHHDARLMN